MMALSLRLGTRGSALALAQSEWVAQRLRRRHPGVTVDLITISTRGDRLRGAALSRVGGKGLFVKEIETALLDKSIDAAVHSLKDLPTDLPEGLRLAATPRREDPRDVLVLPRDRPKVVAELAAEKALTDSLPPGAIVGTSSLRRQALLRHLRSDVTVRDLRGNVDTRLRKLDRGEYDGVLLSAAGLKRLHRDDRLTLPLNPPTWLPAPGQGALALECRSDDESTRELLAALDHPPTAVAVTAERSVLSTLGGGCQVPVGALCEHHEGGLRLCAFVAAPDGTPFVGERATAPAADRSAAEELGRRVAAALLTAGGETILTALQNAAAIPDGR